MLLGSSYSLIIDKNNLDNIISISKFDNFYQKDIVMTLTNNKVLEYPIKIENNSGEDIKYRIDITSFDNKKSDIINYSYTLNNYKSEVNKLSDNLNIIQNQKLENNMTDDYKIKIFFNEFNDDINPYNIVLNVIAIKNIDYATDLIDTLPDTESNNEIRFIGSNPNNYVWFNCDEYYTFGSSHCEKWRIIGSFNTQIEGNSTLYKSLKIIRDLPLDDASFNKDELDGNYDNSFINSYLNGAYYEKMSDSTKKLIFKSKWNIGNTESLNYKMAYQEEQKEFYYAYIGLISPSDYLYSNNKWMNYDREIMLLNKNNSYINVINNGLTKDDSYKDMSFIPSIYLKGDVSFINGDGSINNPYELKIIYPLIYGGNNEVS